MSDDGIRWGERIRVYTTPLVVDTGEYFRTGAIECKNGDLRAIRYNGTKDGTPDVTIEISYTSTGTYGTMVDGKNGAFTIATADWLAGQWIQLPPALFVGVPYVKIFMNDSGTGVDQGTAETWSYVILPMISG
jgi:hypothetical protein